MKNARIIIPLTMLCIAALFAATACQSLEDTYKDFAGDGKVRYVGKCKNLVVTPGWERLKLTWDNSNDATVSNIKIEWSAEGEQGSVVLPGDATEYITDGGLKNIAYTFNIYSVDAEGTMSLPITGYDRPLTKDHELVQGFSTLVRKSYVVGDRLILFMDSYNENLLTSRIVYYDGSVEQELEFTKEIFDNKYLVMENVDISQPIVINRSAKIEGCFDDITFAPYTLPLGQYSMNSDMRDQLRQHYNLQEVTNQFVDELEELHLDYDLKSLEDILYFKSLKKIVLGGWRYTVTGQTFTRSSVTDKDGSLFALRQINALLNANVEVYNDHFSLMSELGFATDMGNPELPLIEYLDSEQWTVNVTPVTQDYDAGEEKILDDDPRTAWIPFTSTSEARVHEITIDMKEIRSVNGFRLTQASSGIGVTTVYFPTEVNIQVSSDNVQWSDAFHYPNNRRLGNGYSESTVLNLPQATSARYIRIKIMDKITSYDRNICLGDFLVF